MKFLIVFIVLTGLTFHSYASATPSNTDTTGYVVVSKTPEKNPRTTQLKIKATLQSAPNIVQYGLVDKSGKLVFLSYSGPDGTIYVELWGGDFSAVRVRLIGYTFVDIPLKDLYGNTVEINVNLMDTPINHYN
ncbi:hypothetical protein GZH53_15690 [Flavihumibacter sp. R14]|nr:hypothetical protein [Flavihumibacter soli]